MLNLIHTSPNKSGAIVRYLNHADRTRIGVSTSQGLHIIRLNDIVYCQAEGNYSQIVLHCGRSILCSKTLKSIEVVLPRASFIRPHQTFIVKVSAIDSIGTNILLRNGKHIPIARRKRDIVKSIVTRQLAIL